MALPHIKLLVAFVLVAGIAVFIQMERTEAAIDMTGTWNVSLDNKFDTKIDDCTAKVTQTGTALAVTISCATLGSGSLAGSITKATGVFVGLSGTVGGDPAVSFTGTALLGGNVATGTWSSTSLSGTFIMTKKFITPAPTPAP